MAEAGYGKQLSFVYDVADLYKTEFAIPVAFEEAGKGVEALESRVRHRMRDLFAERRLLQRIVPDLQQLLDVSGLDTPSVFDEDDAAPGGLWQPEGEVAGGLNFASLKGDIDDGTDPGTGSG